MKLDYIARVRIGDSIDVPNIPDIYLEDGWCVWDTSDQSQGILNDNPFKGISDSVDISISGNYARYSNCTCDIVKSAGVVSTLKANGYSLVGKLIECVVTDGSTEDILRRGIITQIKSSGNIYSLTVSHLANYYNAPLTPVIGGDYGDIVFGASTQKVRLLQEDPETDQNIKVGGGYTPYMTVVSQTDTSIDLEYVYDDTFVTEADAQELIDNNYYIIIEGSEKLIGYNGTVLQSSPKVQVRFSLLPANRKNGDGSWFFATGDEIVLRGTGKTTYYYPYGTSSSIGVDDLFYEDDDVYYTLPSYIDSIQYYADRILLLDSDSSGDFYKPAVYSTFGLDPSIQKSKIPALDNYTQLLDTALYRRAVSGGIGGESLTIESEDELGLHSNSNGVGGKATIRAYTVPLTGQPDANFAVVTTSEVDPRDYGNFDELYCCMNLYANVELGFGNIVSLPDFSAVVDIYAVTNRAVYQIYGGRENDYTLALNNDLVRCCIPLQVSSNDANKGYRNGSVSAIAMNGLSAPITSLFEVASEKELPIRIVTVVKYRHIKSEFDGETFALSLLHRVNVVGSTSYGDDLYMDAKGRNDELGVTVTDTRSAYKSCLQLQNYSAYGITPPVVGWGLDYPTMDFSTVIDTALPVRTIELSYNSDETESKSVKLDMLKYSCGIGYIDSFGLENWADATGMYTGGVPFSKSTIEGIPIKTGINPTRIYPQLYVTYANGTITINNIDQAGYDPSYVDGVSDPDIARSLWFCGNLLFKYYGVRNEYPRKNADIKGIKTEEGAVEYLINQYKLFGAVSVGAGASLYERYTCSFQTSIDNVYNSYVELGTNISIDYPNISMDNSGIVTRVSRNDETGRVSITAECVGDLIEGSERVQIIETGTQVDNIIETGTQSNNYIEGV